MEKCKVMQIPSRNTVLLGHGVKCESCGHTKRRRDRRRTVWSVIRPMDVRRAGLITGVAVLSRPVCPVVFTAKKYQHCSLFIHRFVFGDLEGVW